MLCVCTINVRIEVQLFVYRKSSMKSPALSNKPPTFESLVGRRVKAILKAPGRSHLANKPLLLGPKINGGGVGAFIDLLW